MTENTLENKNQVRNMLDKNKSWYLCLSSKDFGKDVGYIQTNKELDKFLASFAAENNLTKVEASLSRNIAADSDYNQIFNVNISIS